VADVDKPDKAEAGGKAHIAGLRSAAAALRALGLDAAAEPLEAAAAAKQRELDAEKPLASRFRAADDLVRRRAKEVAAAKAEEAEAVEAVAAATAQLKEATAARVAAEEAEVAATAARAVLQAQLGAAEAKDPAAALDPASGWAVAWALLNGQLAPEAARCMPQFAMAGPLAAAGGGAGVSPGTTPGAAVPATPTSPVSAGGGSAAGGPRGGGGGASDSETGRCTRPRKATAPGPEESEVPECAMDEEG
jgi:hypothetical protein